MSLTVEQIKELRHRYKQLKSERRNTPLYQVVERFRLKKQALEIQDEVYDFVATWLRDNQYWGLEAGSSCRAGELILYDRRGGSGGKSYPYDNLFEAAIAITKIEKERDDYY